MKKIYKIFFIFLLLLILVYVSNIFNIPNKIIIFKDEKINIKTMFGINIETNNEYGNLESIEAISKAEEKTQKIKYNVKLFNYTVKQIDVSVLSKTKVIPLGSLIGIKLYSNGVSVVGMSDIEGLKPYEEAGLLEGDRIVSVNDKEIITTRDLVDCISAAKGSKLMVRYIRNNELHSTAIVPIKTKNNEYKVGLWVKDTAGGVGTLSFYNKETGMVAALGHPIVDSDTGEKIDISKGKFSTTNILNLVKGRENNPGKIQGVVDNQENIGEIYANTNFGIYGKINDINKISNKSLKDYDVALRNEITTGEANILCNTENGEPKEYTIDIENIYYNNNENNKSMLVKIKDKELLAKTGGIIQGMSGSPIIQNNKFIGVLTHVLVSDPTTGYAVFADTMVKQMKEVEK